MKTRKQKAKTRQVEFICAYDDGTWDTTVERVPFDPATVEEQDTISVLVDWAYQNLASQVRHRKTVYFGVMNENVTE